MKKDLAKITLSKALGLEGKGMVSLVGAGGKTSLLYALARELASEGKRILITTTTHMLVPPATEVSATVLSPDPEEALEELQGFPLAWNPIFVASHRSKEQDKVVGFSSEGIEKLWDAGLADWILVEADGAARRPLKAPAAHEPVVPAGSRWVVGLVGLDGVGKPLEEAWVFRWEIYGRLCGLRRGEEVSPKSVAEVALHVDGIFKGVPPKASKILWLNKADLPGAQFAAYEIIAIIAEKGWGVLTQVVIGSATSPEPVMACFAPSRE